MDIIRTREEVLTSSQTGRMYTIEGLAPDLLLMDLDLMFIPKGELEFVGMLGEGAFGKVMSARWTGGGKKGRDKGQRMSLVKKDEVVAVKILREETDEKLLVGLLKVFFFFLGR